MAEVLTVIAHGEGALEHDEALRGILRNARLTHVIGLDSGMVGGRPSVAFVVTSDDGTVALCGQTSLRLFLTAADALRVAHGDPRDDEAKGGSA